MSAKNPLGKLETAAGTRELKGEEDLRIEDRNSLLQILEQLFATNVIGRQLISNASTDPGERAILYASASLVVMLVDEQVEERLTSGAGVVVSEQKEVSLSVGEVFSRIIVEFLGESAGLCRSCRTVQQFYEEMYPCGYCVQHYCRKCFPTEPQICSACGLCLCEKIDGEFDTCENCYSAFHDRCGNSLTDPHTAMCLPCEKLALEWFRSPG